LNGSQVDLANNDVSHRLEVDLKSASITYLSSGGGIPQLLATKRFVVDDVAAAATKFFSACAVDSSYMTMVEMTVWTPFCSSVLESCATLL
jgi:hypothetical protein